jgi:hypothetical protein
MYHKRELRGRINGSDFDAADPDNDGTLDKTSLSRSSRNASRRRIRTTKERLTPRSSKALPVDPLRVS